MDIGAVVAEAEEIARAADERAELSLYLSMVSAARFFERYAYSPSGELDSGTAAQLANDAYRAAGVPERVYLPTEG